MRYALLRAPHPNARYHESVRGLFRIEAKLALRSLGMDGPVEYATAGGQEFLFVHTDGPLVPEHLERFWRLSSLACIFEHKEGGFFPMMEGRAFVAEDMPAILKYKGKTNEQFTKFLINVADFVSGAGSTTVLDPLCGRGTTLFTAYSMGMDGLGIEADRKDVAEMVKFCKAYFQHNRAGYQYKTDSMTAQGKQAGVRHRFLVEQGREVCVVLGDTQYAPQFYRNRADILVADLPYGVQHGAQNGAGALLKSCAGKWRRAVRKGGAMAISFNAYTLKRQWAVEVLQDHGLEVLQGGDWEELQHWVEQAVLRDVVVAFVKQE
ncbi:MAG: TRM11 family SAM-dependent methyltransferase [Christensenellales bacterium]|jgi:hypothetical protein